VTRPRSVTYRSANYEAQLDALRKENEELRAALSKTRWKFPINVVTAVFLPAMLMIFAICGMVTMMNSCR
jgi:hypothetical protein